MHVLSLPVDVVDVAVDVVAVLDVDVVVDRVEVRVEDSVVDVFETLEDDVELDVAVSENVVVVRRRCAGSPVLVVDVELHVLVVNVEVFVVDVRAKDHVEVLVVDELVLVVEVVVVEVSERLVLVELVVLVVVVVDVNVFVELVVELDVVDEVEVDFLVVVLVTEELVNVEVLRVFVVVPQYAWPVHSSSTLQASSVKLGRHCTSHVSMLQPSMTCTRVMSKTMKLAPRSASVNEVVLPLGVSCPISMLSLKTAKLLLAFGSAHTSRRRTS
mmetsp:Transcript_160942/g.516551  ORF Transcript_160942/g.516551 Transcript_160942/m.516551 type:complete len:271 (+) Transcript_160942:6508-7320(+)